MSGTPNHTHVQWRKSSFSGNTGNCIEIADVGSGKLVRDSKRPEGAVLRFTADAWASFVTSVRHGDVRA